VGIEKLDSHFQAVGPRRLQLKVVHGHGLGSVGSHQEPVDNETGNCHPLQGNIQTVVEDEGPSRHIVGEDLHVRQANRRESPKADRLLHQMEPRGVAAPRQTEVDAIILRLDQLADKFVVSRQEAEADIPFPLFQKGLEGLLQGRENSPILPNGDPAASAGWTGAEGIEGLLDRVDPRLVQEGAGAARRVGNLPGRYVAQQLQGILHRGDGAPLVDARVARLGEPHVGGLDFADLVEGLFHSADKAGVESLGAVGGVGDMLCRQLAEPIQGLLHVVVGGVEESAGAGGHVPHVVGMEVGEGGEAVPPLVGVVVEEDHRAVGLDPGQTEVMMDDPPGLGAGQHRIPRIEDSLPDHAKPEVAGHEGLAGEVEG